MNIEFNEVGDSLYIYLEGELDEYSANFVRKSIDNKIANINYKSVVFDMSKLDFMDSTGIGVLIGRYKNLIKKNIRSYISNASNTIEKIFLMSGIYEIMPKIS